MWEFEEALKILKDMCEGLPDLDYELMDENVIKKEDRILLSNVEDVLKLLQDIEFETDAMYWLILMYAM